MREESHLEDMRAAIRGDFERLAERRGSQELLRVDEGGHDDEDAAAEPQEATPAEFEVAPEPPAPRRSWLARILGR